MVQTLINRLGKLFHLKQFWTKEHWENQYQNGKWARLNQNEQIARYGTIAGYLRHYASGGAILDLGCGEGILHRAIRYIPYASYVGIDISDSAISQAMQNQGEKDIFIQAELSAYQPDSHFDAIIFNESLYYFRKPVPIFEKYLTYLNKNGVIIISMYNCRRNRRIWKMLQSTYKADDCVKVSHHSGKTWTIKIFKTPG